MISPFLIISLVAKKAWKLHTTLELIEKSTVIKTLTLVGRLADKSILV